MKKGGDGFDGVDIPLTCAWENSRQMKGSIETRVKAVIARHFNLPPSKVRLDAAFVGDLGGDPLDLIELGYQLEAAFNVRLSPSQRDSLPTVRTVVDFLRTRGK